MNLSVGYSNVTSQTLSHDTSHVIMISCCELFDALGLFISARGGVHYGKCAIATCSDNKQVRKFIEQTLLSFDNAFVKTDPQQNLNVSTAIGTVSPVHMSNLLAWAFIGKHATSPQAGETGTIHQFFEYDHLTHQLIGIQPQCVMETLVYDTMLIVSIVTIVVMMLLQMVTQQMATQQMASQSRDQSTMHYQTTQAMVVGTENGSVGKGSIHTVVPAVAFRHVLLPSPHIIHESTARMRVRDQI